MTNNELKNMPFVVLFGERDMTAANLDRNKEYLTTQDIESSEKYLNDLTREIEKRWEEIKSNTTANQ
jgi:HKD family nuclease